MTQHSSEHIARRATAAFNAGRRDKARRLCEQGLARQPREPVLNHLLAAILLAQNETESARTHIETSLAARPDNVAARLLAAGIARAAGDHAGALNHLDRAIAIAPQRDLFVEKARTLDQAGLTAQARAAWRAILDVVPQHQEAAARLGRLAWEEKDFTGATSLLERATASEAPAAVWFDLGLARQDLRDFRGAADAFRSAIAIKSDFAEAALNLGIVLQEAGDPDAAMSAYRCAYRLRPELFGSIAMALTSASHGRLWLDENALKRALEHDPEKWKPVFRKDHA